MRRLEPIDVALLGSGSVVVVALALNEMYGQLVAAIAAYGVGWWVLSLERPDRTRSGEPK